MCVRVACGYMNRVEGSGEINLYEHDFGDESFPLPFYSAILPLIPRSSYHFLCRLLTFGIRFTGCWGFYSRFEFILSIVWFWAVIAIRRGRPVSPHLDLQINPRFVLILLSID
jgi:hypothetical protein